MPYFKDIGLLYDQDVSAVEYAAARDHYGHFLVSPNYINAGVLLFNMKRCRETGIFEKARELIRVKMLMFADQSALIRSTTKKKIIDANHYVNLYESAPIYRQNHLSTI